MDTNQKKIAKARVSTVRQKLAEANLFIDSNDPLRAFQAAEEAYMAAWEAKDYLDKMTMEELHRRQAIEAGRRG